MFLYALLYIGAPWIAFFFERPLLLSLVRVVGLILIFQSLGIVQETILKRRIDFKTRTKASIISAITSGVVGIGMALCDCGVWSLAGQQLSQQIVFSFSLWVFNGWRPQMKVNVDSLKYMWGFGWKLLLSGLLNNFWSELKKVVVSKFYSPALLGQYSNFTSVIQKVTYPALATVQDDKARMVSAYRRVIKTTMFVSVIGMFFMGAISEPLFYCLIGPKWYTAATYLPLICIARSIYPLQAINLNMLKVLGRTDVFLYLEIAKKTILLVPLFIGAFIDIYWMLVASVGTSIITFFLNSYYSGKDLGYTPWMQLKDVASSFVVGFSVALSVFFLKYLPVSNWIILPIQLFVGIIVLVFLSEKLKLSEYIELKKIAIPYLKRYNNDRQKRI